jgi:hypothetical protein
MAEKGGHWVKSAGGGTSFVQAGGAGGGMLSQADAEKALYKLGLYSLRNKASKLAPTSAPNGWYWPKGKSAYEAADAAFQAAGAKARDILRRTEGMSDQEYRWSHIINRLSG